MNLRAFVSNDIGDEVEWVVIESDEGDTKGYFVYYYRNENMAFDAWHASRMLLMLSGFNMVLTGKIGRFYLIEHA